MSRVYNLEKSVESWGSGGIPITMLMNMERRHGKDKPVIRRALVKLTGNKYQYFDKTREKEDWTHNDCYCYVGQVQLFGPSSVIDEPPMNVLLKKTGDIKWAPQEQGKKDDSVKTSKDKKQYD